MHTLWETKTLFGLFAAAAAAAKSLQSYPTLCDPIDGSPPGSPRPWDSPGKNTVVGCHCLLPRLLGEISIPADIQMTPPYGRKRRTKEPLDESERGE